MKERTTCWINSRCHPSRNIRCSWGIVIFVFVQQFVVFVSCENVTTTVKPLDVNGDNATEAVDVDEINVNRKEGKKAGGLGGVIGNYLAGLGSESLANNADKIKPPPQSITRRPSPSLNIGSTWHKNLNVGGGIGSFGNGGSNNIGGQGLQGELNGALGGGVRRRRPRTTQPPLSSQYLQPDETEDYDVPNQRPAQSQEPQFPPKASGGYKIRPAAHNKFPPSQTAQIGGGFGSNFQPQPQATQPPRPPVVRTTLPPPKTEEQRLALHYLQLLEEKEKREGGPPTDPPPPPRTTRKPIPLLIEVATTPEYYDYDPDYPDRVPTTTTTVRPTRRRRIRTTTLQPQHFQQPGYYPPAPPNPAYNPYAPPPQAPPYYPPQKPAYVPPPQPAANPSQQKFPFIPPQQSPNGAPLTPEQFLALQKYQLLKQQQQLQNQQSQQPGFSPPLQAPNAPTFAPHHQPTAPPQAGNVPPYTPQESAFVPPPAPPQAANAPPYTPQQSAFVPPPAPAQAANVPPYTPQQLGINAPPVQQQGANSPPLAPQQTGVNPLAASQQALNVQSTVEQATNVPTPLPKQPAHVPALTPQQSLHATLQQPAILPPAAPQQPPYIPQPQKPAPPYVPQAQQPAPPYVPQAQQPAPSYVPQAQQPAYPYPGSSALHQQQPIYPGNNIGFPALPPQTSPLPQDYDYLDTAIAYPTTPPPTSFVTPYPDLNNPQYIQHLRLLIALQRLREQNRTLGSYETTTFDPYLSVPRVIINPFIDPTRITTTTDNPSDAVQGLSTLFGSLAVGNLAGVVDGTLKFAGTGVLNNFNSWAACQIMKRCGPDADVDPDGTAGTDLAAPSVIANTPAYIPPRGQHPYPGQKRKNPNPRD